MNQFLHGLIIWSSISFAVSLIIMGAYIELFYRIQGFHLHFTHPTKYTWVTKMTLFTGIASGLVAVVSLVYKLISI